MMTFSSAWSKQNDILRASIKQVLSLTMRTGVFWLGATEACPPHAMLMISGQLIYLDKTTEQDCSRLLLSIFHRHQKEL
jgi:hypothetical protein